MTLLGVIAWDPERVSLKRHLLDAIQSRARHAFVHALKYRHVNIDHYQDEVERKLGEEHLARATAGAFAEDVLEAIWDLIEPGDTGLKRLLGAYVLGATRRLDVLKFTGLNARDYDAARHRLARLIRRLPSPLQPSTSG